MVVNWTLLEQQADATIDDQFGEPITVTPYTKDQYKAPVVDSSRAIQSMVGYVVGRNQQLRGAGAAGAMTRRGEADRLVSVQKKYIVTPIEKGDRMFFTKRNETWEVSYVEIGAYNRTVFHLLVIP